MGERLQVFRQDADRLTAEAGAALAAGDGEGLRVAGHTLKGMVAFFEKPRDLFALIRRDVAEPRRELPDAW